MNSRTEADKLVEYLREIDKKEVEKKRDISETYQDFLKKAFEIDIDLMQEYNSEKLENEIEKIKYGLMKVIEEKDLYDDELFDFSLFLAKYKSIGFALSYASFNGKLYDYLEKCELKKTVIFKRYNSCLNGKKINLLELFKAYAEDDELSDILNRAKEFRLTKEDKDDNKKKDEIILRAKQIREEQENEIKKIKKRNETLQRILTEEEDLANELLRELHQNQKITFSS